MHDNVLHREVRAFVSAACFLTRIPISLGSAETTWRDDLRRAPRYFSLVGAAVGAATGIVFWGLCFVLPPHIAAALALACEALITGAFHEDALADYCDAFGGGNTPERVKEILKDSRIGSYGALGLGLGVLVRWSALMSLPPILAIAAAAAAGAIGRAAAVSAMRLLPPVATRESLARDIGARPSAKAALFAVLSAVIVSIPAFVMAPWQTAAAFGLALLPLAYFVSAMKRVLGGVVGDGLGATAFVAQALALVAFAAKP